MCGPVNAILTHALDSHLKNTFTIAKTSSIIQCTAVQFINLKTNLSNSVLWSVTNKTHTATSPFFLQILERDWLAVNFP